MKITRKGYEFRIEFSNEVFKLNYDGQSAAIRYSELVEGGNRFLYGKIDLDGNVINGFVFTSEQVKEILATKAEKEMEIKRYLETIKTIEVYYGRERILLEPSEFKDCRDMFDRISKEFLETKSFETVEKFEDYYVEKIVEKKKSAQYEVVREAGVYDEKTIVENGETLYLISKYSEVYDIDYGRMMKYKHFYARKIDPNKEGKCLKKFS